MKILLQSLIVLVLLSGCTDNEPTSEKIIVQEDGSRIKKEYHENGSLKAIYPINTDGIIEGELKQYYPDGGLLNSTTYINGVRQGSNYAYYSNGNLHIEENYDELGKLEGEFKEYFESGVLKTEGMYKANSKTGEWKFYGEAGGLEEVNGYANNQTNGLQQVYHANGQIAIVGEAKDDHEIGLWTYFGLHGDTLKVEEYSAEGILANTELYREYQNAGY
ncbi:toxin-antitoxin system YwqK family antitoxin [Owenweeksia hongkongensis]|uniref:toxin-antitoxin system YwqK family antitoxin n=1 Tax=Owenweeksia hongkongensis TaxID=253245 RepID=UPI003A91C3C1